jgi:hypothetical protein
MQTTSRTGNALRRKMFWTYANPAFTALLIFYGAIIERIPISLWHAIVLIAAATAIGAWFDGLFDRENSN